MKNKELKLFSNPLVIGASISAGYGTRDGGLGAVLARKVNPDAKITNFARSGYTSVQSTSHLDFDSYEPSVVLALDLFFWDAAREQTGKKFEENTKRLFNSFTQRKIPMIVGKVPVLELPFGGRANDLIKSAQKVNALLEEVSRDQNVLLYDPIHCFLSMESGEYFSDGLHLSDEGNKYCADFFINQGEHRKLEIA